ncbi:MAG: type IV pilus biogenesis/stability protein PilW [Gammaproteobacteria bacterium]
MKSLKIWGLVVAGLLAAACTPGQNTRPDSIGVEERTKQALYLYRQNRLDQALKDIKVALKQVPNNGDANNIAGLIYERMGDVGLAEQHFKKAVELQPNDAYTRNNYGTFLCEQGRIFEAEEEFLTAVYDESYPTPEVAYTNAGVCVRRIPDLDRAAQYFHAALEANPNTAKALLNLARIYYEKERFNQAQGNMENYLAVNEPNAKALLLAYRIENALGNKSAADEYSLRLQQRYPDSQELRQLMRTQ